MAVIDQLCETSNVAGSNRQSASGLKPNASNFASDFPWVKLVRDASPLEGLRGADAQNLLLLDVVTPSASAIAMLELVRRAPRSGASAPYEFIMANQPLSDAENEDSQAETEQIWWELSDAFALKSSQGIPSGISGSMPVVEKRVATFSGRVEFIRDGAGGVLLINDTDGERLDSRCSVDVLQANKLRAGDEFRCEVLRRGGETITRLVKLEPKKIPPERVQEIEQAFKGRWPF